MPIPTKPGYYWALWTSAAEGTGAVAECANGQDWEVVEVWENYLVRSCKANEEYAPKFGVSIPGIQQSQWLENFKWGNLVTPHLEVIRMRLALEKLAQIGNDIAREAISDLDMRKL